jgi:hypothetical protein
VDDLQERLLGRGPALVMVAFLPPGRRRPARSRTDLPECLILRYESQPPQPLPLCLTPLDHAPPWAQPKRLTCSAVSPQFPTRMLGADDATHWSASLPWLPPPCWSVPVDDRGRRGRSRAPASPRGARCPTQPDHRAPDAAATGRPPHVRTRRPAAGAACEIHGRTTSADPAPPWSHRQADLDDPARPTKWSIRD